MILKPIGLNTLFEAQHNAASLLYKWCWGTFGQLNRTTYTFSSNIIYLRLKTNQGFTRTGFKANYTRIPPVTTATIGRNGDTFSTEFSGLGTTFSEVGYIVGVVVIFLFIICFLLGCCFYCTKIKSNEKESGILNDVTELDKLPPAQQLDTEVSCSNIVTSQRGEITLEDDQVNNKSKTYMESTLAYASSTQTGHTEESNSINELLKDFTTNGLQNKELHNLQELAYDMPEERRKEDTNQGEIKHEYDSIDSSKAKSKRTQFGTVSYAAYNDINDSFPVEKRFEHNEVPQDVPYKSFDKKDKYGIEVDGVLYSLPDKKKRDSMEMVPNEAYESYDAEKGQEGVAGGQSPYYYVERNDGRDIGKESEILYDSVESQKQY
ncbi:hypothetical protein HOLleu_25739 [Holothuria leucospilota]|uniref:Uncharacterized protein n=1 Tax=Holothuria leucospilota TaxID=206669 RepID=A0A9Q1BT23_HOLLE|nr:hypothetical protein HOLleu_25739 [Holothuria leucospilota]